MIADSAAFLSINLVILGTSIIFTLVVVNIHFRSAKTHVMGAWVLVIRLHAKYPNCTIKSSHHEE